MSDRREWALLRALRRPGDEAQFTKVIAGVAAAYPGFASAVAKLLIARSPYAKRVAVDLGPAGVPDALMCRDEETVRTAAGVDKGRVDLLFHTPTFDFRLLVEIKLASTYGHDQVKRYLDALVSMDGRRGLLAVTTNLPGVGEPTDAVAHGSGSLRWRYVVAGLRGLAEDLPEPVAGQWRDWLDIMKEDGDFGMSIDETAVRGWATYAHTRNALCQLIEELAPHAAACLRAELAKRAAWTGVPDQPLSSTSFEAPRRRRAIQRSEQGRRA